jgi:hypothetical protein
MGWRVRCNPTYRDVLPRLIADATTANRSGMPVILARTEEELSKLNRALRFADTVQMAAAQQLRDPVVLIQEGSQGLRGWQVRTIADRACGPIELKPRAS